MEPIESVTVAEIVEAIGIPLHDWPHNCASIASAMIRCGLVNGRLVNGRAEFVDDTDDRRHSWIRLPDGRIVDPLCWYYKVPYIHIGAEGPEYVAQPPSDPDASINRLLGR